MHTILQKKDAHTTKKSQPFFSPSFIQPKLTIGAPNDKYEQEADSMADKVMRMSQDTPGVQTKCADCEQEEMMQTKPLVQKMEGEEEEMMQTKPLVQKMEGEEEMMQTKPLVQKMGGEEEEMMQTKPLIQKMGGEEEEMMQTEPMLQKMGGEEEEQLQTKPLMLKSEGGGGVATQALTSQLNNTKGSGSHLPASTNSFMSQAFGSNFSNVKVHTDSNAVQMNQGLNAKAFTHGSDVYFNKGEYSPESSDGKKLLAHELTHVVQQGNRSGRKLSINRSIWSENIQRDLRDDFHGQWGEARQTLNNQYIAEGGIIDRQKSAVHDFAEFTRISDPPSLTDQIIQNSINIILGAVLPGVGNIIKGIATGIVRDSLRGTVGALIDSMVDEGKGNAQNAVQQAWSSQGGSQESQLLKFEITQRQALENIGQLQAAAMNRELARLRQTQGQDDEWEAANALFNSFQQSLTQVYNEQFEKITDIWFTMQITSLGLGAREGVLQILLDRRFPHEGGFRIVEGNLIGSGDVDEIRRRLGRRRLRDIQIPKVIRMNGKMGHGILDCFWNITVTGELPEPSGPTISLPRSNERYLEGPQRIVGYSGHPSLGLPWLAAHHLGLSDLDSANPRNNSSNRSEGARAIWNAIQDRRIGEVGNSSW